MSLSRIRATVSTTKPVASVQIAFATTGTQTVAARVKAAVDSQFPLAALAWDNLAAKVSAAIPLAAIDFITIAYSVELDYRGLNPMLSDIMLTVDVQRLLVAKGFTDPASASDYLWPFVVGKGLNEQLSTSHQLVFSTDKLISENVTTAETTAFGITRAPIIESVSAVDTPQLAFARTFREHLNYPADGPNQYDTYALSYFLEDYVREGFPALHVFKGPSESLGHTETFSYVAQFVRTPNEPLAATEVRVFSSSKVLADAFASADVETVALSKPRSDSIATSDVRIKDIGKAVTEQLIATDDFHGESNADDDETMTFNKVTADVVASADVLASAITKPKTDASTVADVRNFDLAKSKTDAFSAAEYHTYAYQKAIDEMVDAGDEFNATALTDDGEVMIFGKTLSEYQTSSDEYVPEFGKAAVDSATTGDNQILFDVGRAIDDVAAASEYARLGFSKPLADSASQTDVTTLIAGLGVHDRLNFPAEGPNAYDTYALSYFLEDYVREGFPALDFAKTLVDTLHATDDFYGVANADDDETMLFGKSITEPATTGDTHIFATGKALSDTATSSEALSRATSKALADTFSKSDSASKDAGKTLADTFATSQILVSTLNKGVYDTAASADTKTFTSSKPLADSATSSEAFTQSSGKALADTFTKSDVAHVTPQKGLADTVGTGGSGSLVWTDYWDINYTVTTSGVYVGNSQSF